MKKIIIIGIIVLIVIIGVKSIRGGRDMRISGYQGSIESVDGNVLTLNTGVSVQLLGVEPERTDVEMFLLSSYVGKNVTLYSDSKSDQSIKSADQVIKAYVIDDETGLCINRLVVNDIEDAYNPLELTDSSGWVPDDAAPTIKKNLALYMKQRTFLIATEEGIGTGFFINENGVAITNCHVMSPEKQYSSKAVLYQNNPDDSEVYRDKQRNIKNILYSSDLEHLDITIFSVDLENNETVPYFNLAKRHAPMGDKCATLGNPNGYTASYSTGDISAYREDGDRGIPMVQYTMSTNGGNSGGPVCDKYGQVIAVHELGQKDLQGINWGIDILLVRQVLDGIDVKYGGK